MPDIEALEMAIENMISAAQEVVDEMATFKAETIKEEE